MLYKFHLLDENLRPKLLRDYAREIWDGARKIHPAFDWKFDTTFGDIDGQPVQWPPKSTFCPS